MGFTIDPEILYKVSELDPEIIEVPRCLVG
jgi:hypothetical protein